MTLRSLALYPQLPGDAAIEALRARFDLLADKVAYHVTLVFPFESNLTHVELHALVQQACAGMTPFQLSLGCACLQEDGLVVLPVEQGAEQLRTLHARLYSGLLAAYRHPTLPYQPHVTVGRCHAAADSAACLAAAQQLPALCGSVTGMAGEIILPDGQAQIELTQTFVGGSR